MFAKPFRVHYDGKGEQEEVYINVWGKSLNSAFQEVKSGNLYKEIFPMQVIPNTFASYRVKLFLWSYIVPKVKCRLYLIII